MLNCALKVVIPARRNPRAESRKPKEIRNSKSEMGPDSPHAGRPPEGYPHLTLPANSANHGCSVAHSALGFRPSFGFRISGFGFHPSSPTTPTIKRKETPRHGS